MSAYDEMMERYKELQELLINSQKQALISNNPYVKKHHQQRVRDLYKLIDLHKELLSITDDVEQTYLH